MPGPVDPRHIRRLALVIIIFAAAVVAAVLKRPGGTSSNPAPAPGRSSASSADLSRSDPTSAADPTHAWGQLRIGSWNIEWLGKPEDRSGAGRGVAQDPEDLADAIAFAKVDILALEEIVSRVRGTPIRSRELEEVISSLKRRSGDTWEYVLFHGRADGDQLTGVMWNSARVSARTLGGKRWNPAVDEPWPVPISESRSAQGSRLWNRPPHAMKFSAGEGKTDIVLIALHMKADYQGDFARHRQDEARALAAALPAVRSAFNDSDIVLIGDTNCTGTREPAIAAIEQAGSVDLNGGSSETHWRGGSMDRAFVPRDQPEFVGRDFEVISTGYLKARHLDPQAYKRRYSDHYMIVTSMKVMNDDD